MTTPHLVLDGLAFGESPRWHDGRLWVCDWGAGEILVLDPTRTDLTETDPTRTDPTRTDPADGTDGAARVVVRIPSFPLCVELPPDGRALVVASATNELLRADRPLDDAGPLPLSAFADLAPAGTTPWNEAVADGRGGAWVDNIGFAYGVDEPAPGFLVHVSADGVVRRVAEDLLFPNGMVLTDGGATLVVAESHAHRLTAFDVAADGGLSGRRVWAETGTDSPDGVCVDAEGAIWYADVGSSRAVRIGEGGEVLQVVQTDRGCFSCALGGPDGRTLFLVVNRWGAAPSDGRHSQVQAVQVDVPGWADAGRAR